MVSIQIPTPFLPGFQSLVNITAEQAHEIAMFLQEIQVGTGNNNFEKQFNERFPKLAESRVASTIFSIGGFRETELNEKSVKEIAVLLSEAFERQSRSALEANLKEHLQQNLEIILNSAAKLALTYKVFGLLSENNRVFRQSRIVTDLRFIFNSELENKERKAVLIHNLRFNVTENEERKDYYFSLDSNDLQKLKEQINRAIEKEQLIKEQYGDAISIINVTE